MPSMESYYAHPLQLLSQSLAHLASVRLDHTPVHLSFNVHGTYLYMIDHLTTFSRNGRKRANELLWRRESQLPLRNFSKREHGRLWCQSGRWRSSSRGCDFLGRRMGMGMVVCKRDADMICEPQNQWKERQSVFLA
jgi:hypothetical protein